MVDDIAATFGCSTLLITPLTANHSVTPTSDGSIAITRDSSGAIRVNGRACGSVTETNTFAVKPTAFNTAISIDFANPYAPGATRESSGISEIEFVIDGGTGTDSLRLIGGSGADIFAFGTNGIADNSDSDADLTVSNLDGYTASGSGGADTITGQGGVFGTTGAFTSPLKVYGGAGNDTLKGGSSSADTVDFSDVLSGVNVDLRAGTASGDGNDSVASFEKVVGTSYNDTVSLRPDVIETVTLLGGDDTCKQNSRGVNDGGVEGDSCDGGPGTDTYDGSGILRNSPGISIDFVTSKVSGSGPDFIPGIENAVGTNGEDVVIFKPDQINIAQMLGGDDICKQISRGVNDGGVEGDTCDGGAGTDTYDGTGILRNSPGVIANLPLNIVSGSGPDHIPGVENFNGTNGEDEVVFEAGQINVANMGAGQDVCKQVSVPDVASPTGNSTGVEGDTCNGEAGVDTYDGSGIIRNSPGISIDFVTSKVSGSGPDFIPGVESGIGTGGDDAFIDEDDDCNLARGLGGDDTWFAGFDRPGSENDPQRGVCGDDVDLGEGHEVVGDTLDYAKTIANSPGVIMNLPLGVVSGSPEDLAANAENAFGSEHDDIIIGSSENNDLRGRGGNDTISGGGGNDTMDGGSGDDTLTSSGSGDSVTCNNGSPQSGAEDTATSFEGCQPGSGDDVIYGTEGDDVLNGGDGNDTIYGLGGKDTINGGAGNDQIFGGAGSDTLNGGDGNDSIDGGSSGDTIDGGAGNDNLNGGEGNGGDTINGGDGDDSLYGGNGPDKLDGQADTDTIDGGLGPDACAGESKTNCES